MKLSFYLLLINTVCALQAAPVLLASHKLVPELKKDIHTPNTKIQLPLDVTHMVKRLATECSSDVYLLVNVPGLTQADLTSFKKDNWPHLQKYLHMSSSVVGLPWVEGNLDYDHLSEYIVRTCKAEAIVVHTDEHEVEHYIDTRKRVIRMELAPIPSLQPSRDEAIRNVDDVIRKILRKLPSPHYTILISSSEPAAVHPIPEIALENMPEHFELFHDIVNDPSRESEKERNNYMYQEVEPIWKEYENPTDLYLARRRQDEVHFFDADLWRKKEKLVMTLALIVASLFVFEIVSVGRNFRKNVTKDKLL